MVGSTSDMPARRAHAGTSPGQRLPPVAGPPSAAAGVARPAAETGAISSLLPGRLRAALTGGSEIAGRTIRPTPMGGGRVPAATDREGGKAGGVRARTASPGRLRSALDAVLTWAEDDVAQRVLRPAPKAADLLKFVKSGRCGADFAFYKGGTLFHAIARSPDAKRNDILEILHAAAQGEGLRIDPDARAGALPDGRAGGSETALHTALRHRNLPAVEMLLGYGADPRLPDGRGRSALAIAEGQREEEARKVDRCIRGGASDAVGLRQAIRLKRVADVLDLLRGGERRPEAAGEGDAAGDRPARHSARPDEAGRA